MGISKHYYLKGGHFKKYYLKMAIIKKIYLHSIYKYLAIAETILIFLKSIGDPLKNVPPHKVEKSKKKMKYL